MDRFAHHSFRLYLCPYGDERSFMTATHKSKNSLPKKFDPISVCISVVALMFLKRGSIVDIEHVSKQLAFQPSKIPNVIKIGRKKQKINSFL